MTAARRTNRNGKAPARERVYRHIRDRILRGELRGGGFIEEEQTSRALGTSRTPVREALHRLHAERLIELVPRRGALVRQVTARELLDVYEARKLIESHAVRRICEARIPIPEEMYSLLGAMKSAQGRDDFTLTELDRQFHRALISASGNLVLTEMYDALRSRQQLVAVTTAALHPPRLRVSYAEHRDLMKVLERRDAERAVKAFLDHLQPMPEVLAGLGDPGPSARQARQPAKDSKGSRG